MEQISTFSTTECQTPVPFQNTKTEVSSPDLTDYAPRPFTVSNLDIVFMVVAVLSHIVDVFTDINVAYQHYDAKEYVFFYCTIAVVLIPSFINSLVSWFMYHTDRTSLTTDRKTYRDPFQSKFCWLRIMFLMFLLAPLVRCWDTLTYAVRCRLAESRGDKQSQEKFYRLMIKECSDSALLRIFEFLESASQQVIQLSALLLGHALRTNANHILIAIVFSFGGMAVSLMSYQRDIRFPQEDKRNITYAGGFTIFFWQLMMVTSRIVALSALSSVCWPATIILVTVHGVLMLLVLSCCEENNFCSNHNIKPKWRHRLGDFLFDVSLSLAYIFLYISPGDGATRNRYAFYYTMIGFENIAAVLIWTRLIGPEVPAMWYYYVVMFAVIGGFFAGIASMILYYTCVPNKKTRPNNLEQSANHNEELNNLQQLQTAL